MGTPLIICDNPPFIFIKSKKTAGTSTEAYLQGVLFGDDTLRFEASESREYTNGYVSGRNLHGFQNRRVFWGLLRVRTWASEPIRSGESHASLDQIIERFGIKQIDSYDVAINLRKPTEQTVSFFWWDLMRLSHLLPFDIHSFAKQQRPSILRAIFHVWFLVNWRRVRDLSFSRLFGGVPIAKQKLHFIRQERLRADLGRLCRQLNLRENGEDLPALKSGLKGDGVATKDYFSWPLITWLKYLRKQDSAIFEANYGSGFPEA